MHFIEENQTLGFLKQSFSFFWLLGAVCHLSISSVLNHVAARENANTLFFSYSTDVSLLSERNKSAPLPPARGSLCFSVALWGRGCRRALQQLLPPLCLPLPTTPLCGVWLLPRVMESTGWEQGEGGLLRPHRDKGVGVSPCTWLAGQ